MSRANSVYPSTPYQRAAEALADVAEDVAFTTAGDGLSVAERERLRDAWQAFVDVAADLEGEG
ncbi:hypothetical protein [Angustibacter sp. Root456]|uniref:hypothetical protein n=1 Tax=Angustibacter sp. Root456 TaxID=1736539 RepID=UPI0006F5E4F4|nr:hypothetical protein [Angustibacter sp. Root456]KQX65918.1 hypothetical protein ASD06_05805 [Angustibacter sp. Root456]